MSRNYVVRAIRTVNPTISWATMFRLRARLEREGFLKAILLFGERRLHIHPSEEQGLAAECCHCGKLRWENMETIGLANPIPAAAKRFTFWRIYMLGLCKECTRGSISNTQSEQSPNPVPFSHVLI